MTPLEVTLAVPGVDRRELALQNWDEEVTGAARRFEEAGIDALRLGLHEIEHRLNHPRGREHLTVVGHARLRLYALHRRSL